MVIAYLALILLLLNILLFLYYLKPKDFLVILLKPLKNY